MTSFRHKKNINAVIVAVVCFFYFTSVYSDELEERRIRISLAIFPKIIAVDRGLSTKLTDNQFVKLLMVYHSNKTKAEELAELLRNKVKNIGGNKVEIVVEKISDVSLIFTERVAGIFVTERFNDIDLNKVIRVGISQQVTVFSPYAGDVERGATVGIAIGSRVKPYFNIATLNASKVIIHKKLLKVSKRYE